MANSSLQEQNEPHPGYDYVTNFGLPPSTWVILSLETSLLEFFEKNCFKQYLSLSGLSPPDWLLTRDMWY